MVAVVGGGGKTSLVFGLIECAVRRGLSAGATTTTRFTRPPGGAMPELVITSAEGFDACAREKLATGGSFTFASGIGTRDRMEGFATELLDGLAGVAGLWAIEADGSAHRPFKSPGEHEPVIPSRSTDVVVCVGLDVLGHPLGEQWVHRPGIVSALSGTPEGAPVVADTILDTLLHEDGGRKNVPPQARLHALLNHPRTPEHQRLAEHIAARLVYGGYASAVTATAHEGAIHSVVR